MTERTPSLLDAACEALVQDLAQLSPTEATAWGIEGHDGELQDFSPEYWEALAERKSEMLEDLDAFDESRDSDEDSDFLEGESFDEVDQVTSDVLRDRLRIDVEEHYRGEDLRLLNNIESPVQIIRDTFMLMPQKTPEQREAIRSRLSKVPQALRGYRSSLQEAAQEGHIAAFRQVHDVMSQCDELSESGGVLEKLGVDPADESVLAARQAFGELSDWMGEHLAPHASNQDRVGRERYELASHKYVGDILDPDDTYEWGVERLRVICEEQKKLAEELYGEGTSVRKAYRLLNDDPAYQVHGTDEFQRWMRASVDKAIEALDGQCVDIPEAIREVECRIDPSGTGGIFYTPPTEDLSRSGAMWWSVPAGQTVFHTWQELSTVYHEGVPGHHLQLGQTLLHRDTLNSWRRLVCWISGHGEGWALYAEHLMNELGFQDDPGNRMGYLDQERLRAARVVLDIGVHLGKPTLDGTGVWDATYAKNFLRENTAMPEGNFEFELTRYLGWPGQASSYAVGQKAWLELRRDAVTQGYSLRDFHREALALGSIPMSILRDRLLAEEESFGD